MFLWGGKYSAPLVAEASYVQEICADQGVVPYGEVEPYPTPNLVEQDLKKILDKISFVDKIVFGKLNYNVKTSQFKNNSLFYEKCAQTVIDFCEKRRIDYHIKFGTQEQDNKKTAVLFKKKLEKCAVLIEN